MRYIDSWLTGLGLDYIIPKLKANGITTPKKLAQLSLIDMYQVVGVEDSEDRKKLYFLIQRLQTILNNKSDPNASAGANNDEDEEPAPPPDVPSPSHKKSLRVQPSQPQEELMKSTGTDRSSEDDLRVLRKNRRTTMDTSMLGSFSKRPETAGAEAPARSEAASKIARRSSHIPQIDRSTSAENISAVGNGPAGADYRGPVAVPTAALARKLHISTKDKTGSGSGSNPNSPVGGSGIPAASTRAGSKIPAVSAETGGQSKIRAPAKPTATDAARSAAEKQALLLQKQKQLAAEEEALLKLQRSVAAGNGRAPAKSLRSAAPAPVAEPVAAPSPPPSPPRAAPVTHPAPREAPVARSGAGSGTSAAQRAAEGRRSPPPPYDWEQPAPPPSQPPPRHANPPAPTTAAGARNAVASAKNRSSYPPRPEYSPSTVESEVDSDAYAPDSNGGKYATDTDSYDNPYDSGLGDDLTLEEEHRAEVIVDMAIRVVVRKRPISKRELSNGDRDVLEVLRHGRVLVHEPKVKVDLTKIIETQDFRFDDAFEAHETNETIYARTIKNLVSFVFEGGKASCFAYGQTGSGKTFTMMGCRPEAPAEAVVNAGLYVLAARDIFKMVQEPQYRRLRVFVSCFEIYGGKLFDLLNERGVVKCLEDAKQQVQTPGLTEHQIRDVGELLDLMSQAHNQRSTGSTGANSESSRSHMVMQIVLREPEPTAPAHQRMRGRPNISIVAPPASGNQGAIGGKLSFIDLAGSERGADTTHNSKQTRMEGAEINTSLLALKEVIRSLERKHGHTPFRGSKLTQVLKDSFVGEKTRTCMVACVSPSHSNCEHTLNTLRYADRVKEHQSAGSGNGGAGPHVSSASNYDSLAYDAGGAVRPKTAGVAAPQADAARGRPNTASSANSRPVTAMPQATAPAIPPGGTAKRGADSSTNSEASGYSSRQAPQPSAMAKVVPSRPAPLGVASGRSASVSAITAKSSAYALQQQQQQQAALQALSPNRAKEALISRKGIPVRQGSAPRGSVLSPTTATAAAPAPASPAGRKMLRQQSSPMVLSGGRASLGSGGPSASARAGAASSRRSSAGSTGGGGNVSRQDISKISETSFDWNDERVEGTDNPMNRYRQSPASASASRNNSRLSAGTGGGESEVEELSFARSDGEEDRGGRDPFDSTELIQKTVGLLSAHKSAIAEMVEVMKEEMELVQEMENIDERDSDRYIDRLARLLSAKSQAITALRTELNTFQSYRGAMC